jgi:lysine-specific permease
LPLFIALWLVYKKKHNTKVVDLKAVNFDAADEEAA